MKKSRKHPLTSLKPGIDRLYGTSYAQLKRTPHEKVIMPDNLTLNIASMDERHDSFLELLAKLQSCGNAEFLPLFKEIVERTRKHFAFKEEMMHTYNFYARSKSCSDVRGRTGNAFTLTTNPLFLESGMAAFRRPR